MSDDIDELARICYEAGVTPIDYAESCVRTAIDANELIGAPRDVLARRILAALLDAGWHPPVWPIPEPGAHREP